MGTNDTARSEDVWCVETPYICGRESKGRRTLRPSEKLGLCVCERKVYGMGVVRAGTSCIHGNLKTLV